LAPLARETRKKTQPTLPTKALVSLRHVILRKAIVRFKAKSNGTREKKETCRMRIPFPQGLSANEYAATGF